MESSQRFEILVTPDSGEGVHPQIMKLISNSPEGLELEMKEIPHVESALSLLKNGHGDLVAVSGKWWHENRDSSLSEKLVLPRREPTRVLVGENKPEYIPKGGIIVVDCDWNLCQFFPDVARQSNHQTLFGQDARSHEPTHKLVHLKILTQGAWNEEASRARRAE